MKVLTEMNRDVPSQIPRVLLALSLVLLVCLPGTCHADRACCERTKGCNLRRDCRCRILELTCTDPSLGIPTIGKRAPPSSAALRLYDTYRQSPFLERIAEYVTREQDDRWKRKRSSSSGVLYPFYESDLTF